MRRDEQSKKLKLERIVFIGRTFTEYMDMFSLSLEDLRGKRILDCPAGACSFTAVGNQFGLDVTACDIAYDHPVDLLKQKGIEDIEHAMIHMHKAKDNYKWNYFQNISELKQYRLQALEESTTDMKNKIERYVPASLPTLPFKDGEFDIVLSAHFLFMYADRLDFEFHIHTIFELLRVANDQVRIYPLVDLEGKRYKYLDKVIQYLSEKGCKTEEVHVNYEFQANANSMLCITQKKGTY